MDWLRHALAPIPPEGWAQIEEAVRRILQGHLSARRLLDFRGPHGWTYAAASTGRVRWIQSSSGTPVQWGLREALPVAEARVPFQVSMSTLENISRGDPAGDLQSAQEAARRAGQFEEEAIYYGLQPQGWPGWLASSPHRPVPISSEDAKGLIESVEAGILCLQKSGIGGPYALVLGTAPYAALMTANPDGYPPRRRIEGLVEGGILWSPALSGGAVVSRRGGDAELIVGQDWAIGYLDHDRETVHLFLVETFAFRVLEPAAAVELKRKAR